MSALEQPLPHGHQEWDLLREQGHFDLYMGEALEGSEKARIEDHLTTCADCRRYLSDLKKVDAFLMDTMKSAQPLHLEERIQRNFLKTGGVRRRWVAYLPKVAAAGLFFMFLGVVVDATDTQLASSPYSVANHIGSEKGLRSGMARLAGEKEELRDANGVGQTRTLSLGGLMSRDEIPGSPEILAEVSVMDKVDSLETNADRNETADQDDYREEKGNVEGGGKLLDPGAMAESRKDADAGEKKAQEQWGWEGPSRRPLASPVPAQLHRQSEEQSKFKNERARGADASDALDLKKSAKELMVAAQEAPASTETGTTQASDPAQAAEARGVKLIRNGEITYEVEGYATTFSRVGQLTAENGGYIASENAQKLANGRTQGTLVIRVPSENFMALLNMLRGIGELKHQNVRVQDVTKSFFDTQSRIQSLDARRESLLKALEERKGDLEAYVKFEAKLAEVLEELEKLKGEMKFMENQVAFSTLTLTLIETGVDAAASMSLNEKAQMSTAVPDVDKAFDEARRRAEELKATVVSSRVNRGRGRLETRAHLILEIPSSRFDELLKAVGELGRVTSMNRSSDDQPLEGVRRKVSDSAVRKDGLGTLTLEFFHLPDFTVEQDDILLQVGDALAVYRTVSDMEKGGRLEIRRKEIDSFSQKDAKRAQFEITCAAESAPEILGAIRALGHVQDERGQPISALTAEGEPIPSFQRRVVELRLQIVKLESVKTRSLEAVLLANDVQAAWNEIRSKAAGSKDWKVLQIEIDDNSPKATRAAFRLDVPAGAYDALAQFLGSGAAGFIKTQKFWNLADKPGEMEKIPSFQEQRAEVTLQLQKLLPLTARSEEMGVKVEEVETSVAAVRSLVKGIEGARLLKNEHNHDTKTAEIEAEIPEAAFEKALADLKAQVTGKVYHKKSWTLEENPEDPSPAFQRKVGRVAFTLGELLPLTVKTCALKVYEDNPDELRVKAEELGRKGGRILVSNLKTGEDGSRIATVDVEVPLASYDAMLAEVRDLDGDVLNAAEFMENLEDPRFKDEKLVGRIAFTITNSRAGGVAPGGFFGFLSTTFRDVFRGVQIASRHLVVGLAYGSPFLLVLWLVWRRRKKA